MPKNTNELIDELAKSISSDVGNINDRDIEEIQTSFDKVLDDALHNFNSSAFDDDGFIKKMRDLSLDDKKDKDMMKHVLTNIRSDYINVDAMNQSELLLRRDIQNVCTQMPEMNEVINIIRDAIIECNTATGEVSRSISFDNYTSDEAYETRVKEIEQTYNLKHAIKNFIVPNCLMHGEVYVHIVPYAKLFAELEAIHNNGNLSGNRNYNTAFRESIPNDVFNSFSSPSSLYSDENLSVLMESVSAGTKVDTANEKAIDSFSEAKQQSIKDNKAELTYILENISVASGSSAMMVEYGPEGFKDLVMKSFRENGICKSSDSHFMEAQNNYAQYGTGPWKDVDQDGIDFSSYADIKGAYVKFMNGLKMVPIRMDRRVIGYYYVTTTMDLQTNAANPNGIVDLSYQTYMRDRNMVDRLASMIIKSFDKKMLEKNIKLKNEIADVIMAHKFSEGRLSFIYIPENEIIRITINEDEDGKGHSVLEPTLFSARSYLMLDLYNLLYVLNNTTTRVHYVKSSGLNKDYSSIVERTMRKFQSRRITIDDIYSYSGVLNKIGGLGEMILPAGRNDYKALETDTIPAVDNPISLELLEKKRKEAISGTGVPNMLAINAMDEVDFAKTLEMANTRFISTASSLKIDFNGGITRMYKKLMKSCTDIDDDVINSFHFQFNSVKQQDVSITADMLQNFDNIVAAVKDIYYKKEDMEDQNGNPTYKQMYLKRKLAEKYLPQLDFDDLDEMMKDVNLKATSDALTDKIRGVEITDEDVEKLK